MNNKMPTNDDYRKFLDERFNHINDVINLKFEKNEETLSQILTQSLKTNSRVTHLEEEEMCNKEVRSKMFKIEENLSNYKKSQADLNFFQRHPKLGLLIIVVSVIITLFSYSSIMGAINPQPKNDEVIEMLKEYEKENKETHNIMLNKIKDIEKIIN